MSNSHRQAHAPLLELNKSSGINELSDEAMLRREHQGTTEERVEKALKLSVGRSVDDRSPWMHRAQHNTHDTHTHTTTLHRWSLGIKDGLG